MEPERLDLRLWTSMLYGSAGHLAECPDLGPACRTETPPVPYHHHVALVLSETGLDVAYGVTPWLAVEARATLRVVDTKPTYSELDGSPKLVPDDIHHHDRTIVGPSDPWLVARFAGRFGELTTATRFGLSFPLGSTEPDPYELGARGEWHEHTQLGTGTVVPIVGFGLSYRIEPVLLSAAALGLVSVYENRHGFRAPTRVFGGVRASMPLLSGKLTPYVTVDIAHESTEVWSGVPGGLEGNNARTDLLAGAGLAWEFAPTWQLDLNVRVRAARFTHAAAFDYPGMAQLAISKSFDLSGGAPKGLATEAMPTPRVVP
ncbi:hypothetical protein [Polyangium aurulentum]|uniref:hypothetical protein n=1 Tax=Polyangium aurulentum TaxID=2567896 RepID=UPI0010AE4CBB|nr:hypothetical protein [Polyangium aurulentum]UQA56105.1 hypothetical protein E8A73_032980 [Polyangium aurulentum]